MAKFLGPTGNFGALAVAGAATVGTTLGVTGDLTVSGGDVSLNHGTANTINWGQVGSAPPTINALSAGVKLMLWNNIDATHAGYAIGIEGGVGNMWFGASTTAQAFRWYGGTTLAATLTGTGDLTLVGDATVSGGNLSLSNGTSNMIDWATTGVGPPTYTTRSVGTKLLLYPGLAGGAVDYAIGVDNSTQWFSVPGAGHQFRWYSGTAVAATLTSAGVFTPATPLAVASGGTGKAALTEGSVLDTSTSGATSSTNELVLASVTVTCAAGDEVCIIGTYYNGVLTVATDTFFCHLYDGSTAGSGTKLQTMLILNNTVNTGGCTIHVTDTPSAGTHTYTMRLQRNSGTGTLTAAVSANSPQALTVFRIN